MHATSVKFRFASWLAIAAMALNALWPLLANAQPVGAPSLLEICTSQGMKTIAADPDSGSDDFAAKHLQPHCPLCSFGSDKASAPPSAPLHIGSASLMGCLPPSSINAAVPGSEHYTPALPRAPPALS
jgi:hypothetical protein